MEAGWRDKVWPLSLKSPVGWDRENWNTQVPNSIMHGSVCFFGRKQNKTKQNKTVEKLTLTDLNKNVMSW